MRPRASLTLTVLFLAPLLTGTAIAQEEELFDLFRPRLDLGMEGTGAREFAESDTEGFPDVEGEELRAGGFSLLAHIPLGRARFTREGRILGRQIFAHAALSRTRTEIGFLDRDPVLLQGALGGTALFLSQRRNLYAAAAFVSFAEEDEAAREGLDPRVTGLFLATRRSNPDLSWVYGGAFTFMYGRGLPLPVLGFLRTLNPDWKIGGILPFVFRATRQATPERTLHLFFRVKGNRYEFANQGDFPRQPEEVDLRLVEGRLGAQLEFLLARDVGIQIESGLLVGRRLIFADGDDEFIDARARPGGYVRLGARFSFGESLLTESRPRSEKPETP